MDHAQEPISFVAEPLLADARTFCLAENPLWDERRGVLFWTDIDDGRLYKSALSGDGATCLYEGDPVGGFTLEADGRLALFRVDDIVVFDPETRETGPARSVLRPDRDRFNDVIALPGGGVLAGSIGRGGGAVPLEFFATDSSSTPVAGAESAIGNGLALLGDSGAILWTDTPGRRLLKLDQRDTGAPSLADGHACVIPDTPGEGFPDGLTIDTEGRLYSARWAGSCVRLLDRSDCGGWRAAGRVDVPTPNVTACAFGGAQMDRLIITSAGGTVYAADVGRRGIAERRSRLFC